MDISNNNTVLSNALYGLQSSAKSQLNLGNVKTKEQAAEAAENFEAFFISKTMESMFEGVKTDSLFGGGHAEKIYRSMLLDEYGKEMAKTGRIGVKEDLMRSILEMQEMESKGYIEG